MEFRGTTSEEIQREIEEKRLEIQREIEEKRLAAEREITAKRQETDRKLAEQRQELERRHQEQIRIMNGQVQARDLAARIDADIMEERGPLLPKITYLWEEEELTPEEKCRREEEEQRRIEAQEKEAELQVQKAREKAEAERQAKAEADRQEAEQRAALQAEEERKLKEEFAKKQREAEEIRRRTEADRLAQEELAKQAKAEAERRAQEEAERIALMVQEHQRQEEFLLQLKEAEKQKQSLKDDKEKESFGQKGPEEVKDSSETEAEEMGKGKKRSGGNSVFMAFLALLIAVLFFFGTFYLYKLFNPQVTGVVYPVKKTVEVVDEQGKKQPQKELEEPVLQDRINVLVMGTDYGDSEADRDDPKRTDAMLLLSFDPEHHKIGVLSIPRDTKVILPGHRDPQKINAAYAFGGVMMAKQTVANLLGIPITHYALADWQAFTKIVDLLGGVDLTVEHDMIYEDPYANLYINLKAGYQHLDGVHAGQYVRYRGDELGDIGRAQRQQKFLKAAAEQMLTVGNVTKIPALIKTVSEYVETDMNALTMLKAANSVRIFGKGGIRTGTLYGEVGEENNISYWLTNEADIRRILSELEIPSSKLEMDKEKK